MTTPRIPATRAAMPPIAAGRAPAALRSEGEFRWVELWHLPVRAMHWIAALAIVVLMVTGLIIASPAVMAGSPRATFALQWVRFTHFVAAGVLVATAIVRIYWLVAGNRFEQWRALVPVRRRDWVNFWAMLRAYAAIRTERAPRYLGHNPLQQLLYTFTYVVALVMVLTGFMLFGQANPGGLTNTVFGWMRPLFGGAQWVRVIHHVLSWYFLVFVIIHVYLAIRADVLEHGGMVSSMISGGRFVRKREQHVDD